MDGEEVENVLNSDRYAKEVREDEREAALIGIHGVPYFIIGGKYGLSGAQPVEILKNAINEALTDEKFSGMTCGADGCKFDG